MKQTYTMSTP